MEQGTSYGGTTGIMIGRWTTKLPLPPMASPAIVEMS